MGNYFSSGSGIQYSCCFVYLSVLVCKWNSCHAQNRLTNFLFGTKWKPGNDLYGIFPMIAGSLYVTAGAILVGLPIGLMIAVFYLSFVLSGCIKS